MSEHFLKSTLFPTTDLHFKPLNFTNLPNSSILVVVGAWKVAPSVLLMLCFMVGVPINMAVVIDICRKYKRYASKVNPNILLLVLNLAVVDSVTLSISPFAAFTLIWGFNLGDASCKMFIFTITSCLHDNSSSDQLVTGVGRMVAPCLLVACFMVGFPVNVAVVIDICRKYKRYVSKVNPNILLLVVNLAVVDSVTLSTSPFVAFPLIWGFNLGDASCKMLYFTITSCIFISVVTVTGISMNYFLIVKFAVANPRMMAQVRRGRGTVLFLGGVCAGALLLSISTLFTKWVEKKNGLLSCIHKAPNDTEKVAMLFLETVVGFILPFLILPTSYVCLYRNTAQKVMSATSTEQRKKINHFVVSVLVTFLICWTPYHIINMVDVSTTLFRVSSPEVYKRLKYFRNPAGDSMKSLCFFNSVINPFLYAFTLRKKLT